MGVKPVHGADEFNALINRDQYVVFDFWATWCGPCKVISPIFERFSEQFSNLEFYKVDVDAEDDIAQIVGIRAMPTFILFRNGQKVKELIGANPKGLQDLLGHAR